MVKPLPPPEVTEKWPPLNYINPETRPWELLLGITIFMMGLTIIIVLLRTYVRFILLHAPGWDDYFIWIATIGSIGLCITVNLSMNYGWDRHIWDQQFQWFEESEMFQYMVQVEFIIIMTFAKLSALCTYLRVARGTRYRRFVWVTIVFIVMWGLAFLLATVFQCNPIHLYWTASTTEGCTNEDSRLLFGVVINIITDLQVVLMPLPIVYKLQIPRREKLTLGFLMCLGLFATVASVIRTIVMAQSLNTYDMTWNGMYVWIWLIIECDLSIICISVPVLRTLIKHWIPNLLPTHHGAHGGTGKSSSTGGHGGRHNTSSTTRSARLHAHGLPPEASLTSLIPDDRATATPCSLSTFKSLQELKALDGFELHSIPQRQDSLPSRGETDYEMGRAV